MTDHTARRLGLVLAREPTVMALGVGSGTPLGNVHRFARITDGKYRTRVGARVFELALARVRDHSSCSSVVFVYAFRVK